MFAVNEPQKCALETSPGKLWESTNLQPAKTQRERERESEGGREGGRERERERGRGRERESERERERAREREAFHVSPKSCQKY